MLYQMDSSLLEIGYVQTLRLYIIENPLILILLVLAIILSPVYMYLWYKLSRRAAQDNIPKNWNLIFFFLFTAFLTVSFLSLYLPDEIASIASWLSASFLALFIVVLQDLNSYKSDRQIESIYSSLLVEEPNTLNQKYEELQKENAGYKNEIAALKKELETLNSAYNKVHEMNINVTVQDKRSLVSVLDNYLNKNRKE